MTTISRFYSKARNFPFPTNTAASSAAADTILQTTPQTRNNSTASSGGGGNKGRPRLANDDNDEMDVNTMMMDWEMDAADELVWDNEDLEFSSSSSGGGGAKGHSMEQEAMRAFFSGDADSNEKSLSDLEDDLLAQIANLSPDVLDSTDDDRSLLDLSFLTDMAKQREEHRKLEKEKERQRQQQTQKELMDQRFNSIMDIMDFKTDPLLEKQKELEARFVDRATARYRKAVEGAVSRMQGASLPPAADVMVEWFWPVVKEIRRLQSNSVFKSPSEMEKSMRDVAPLLSHIDAERMAVLAIHEMLSSTMKIPDAPLRDIALRIGNAIVAEGNLMQLKRNPRAMKLLTNDSRIALSINKLASFFLEDTPTWPRDTILQLGSMLVEVLNKHATVPALDENGEPTMVPAFTHEIMWRNGKSLGVVRGHEELFKIMESRHVVRELIELKHLPMVLRPKPWEKHDEGAYLTQPTRIMRTKGSSLQSFVLRDALLQDICEGLNVLGDAEWIVHNRVLETVLRVWDEGGGIAEIPSRTDDDLPEKPETDDVNALRQWKRNVAKTKQHNSDLHSLRCDLMYKLEVAREFVDQPIYFPHNIDFRGRAYPIPPHLNHMGADLNRSLLMFKKGHPIGKDGIFWLKIHMANLCGRDKFSFEERIKFVDENLDNVMDSADRPLDGKRWWLDSENPWQTLAACIELTECLRSPVPEEFHSQLPVQIDGSCNGLQHYAALGRDNLGALHVNLLPTEKPMDVYNGVLAVVLKKIEFDARRGEKTAQLLQGKVYRQTIKQVVMTSVYGVTFVGAREQVARRLKEKKEVVEEMIYPCSVYLARITLKSLGEVFRGAREIMDWLNEIAHLVSSEDEPVMWATPLGLPVVQPYFAAQRMQVKTVLQTVNLVDRKDQMPVSRARQKSAFPPNYVHSLDASHMFLTAIACQKSDIEFASVHDSFWCHANHVERMNRIIREQFIYLHSQPLLETLLESCQKRYPHVKFPPVPKKGKLDLQRVMDAPYFFD